MDRGSLELLLARGLSLEQIAERFRRHPSTVSYWLNRYGLEANGAEKHAAKGAVDEDRLRSNGVTLSMETLRAEAGTCVLVCSNCHAELEAGVTQLPDTVALIGGMTSDSD